MSRFVLVAFVFLAVIYTAFSAAQFGRQRGPPGGLLGQHHPPGAPGVPGAPAGGVSGEAAGGSAEAEVGGEEAGGEFAEEAGGAGKGGAPEGGRNVKAIRGGYINVH